ncbi:CDP-alcohol phosphatidyltransferase family protein [Elioraea rosea]|uniref:CDP-alcohol phosphatidyltransferase family protein n=1 Tax=Elioraea rosea TaxID=2492390 RepID=UPI001185A6F7|nr:phosphatidylcholine/phosphatidylserine synthase [Elioraea rosea]
MKPPRSPAVDRWRQRLRRRSRPRFKGLSFNRLIPNLMTLVGLCAGLTAIRFALAGRWDAAATAIVIAAVIDGLDGRIARLLKATSRFGAEFDSLADFLCFGVAPALVLYLWTLSTWGGLGWAPCLMYAVCAALRLARFNAAIDGAPKPAYTYNFFTGVPAPAGAGLALFPLFVSLQADASGLTWLGDLVQYPAFSGIVLLTVGALMVSTVPTWSFKNFKIPQQVILPLLLGAGLFIALLVSEPWAALALIGLVYATLIPFGVRSYRRLRAEAEAMALVAPEEEPRAETGTA